MHKDLARILITEQELDEIITRIAAELDRDYAGEDKRLVLLCILKGSVVVMGELMKRLPSPWRSILCVCPLTAVAPKPPAM